MVATIVMGAAIRRRPRGVKVYRSFRGAREAGEPGISRHKLSRDSGFDAAHRPGMTLLARQITGFHGAGISR